MDAPNVEEFFLHIRHMPMYFRDGKMALVLGYKLFNLSQQRAHAL